MAAVITEFLGQFTDDQLEMAEEAGIKLNRLLLGFLEAEVLPQAMRAAELGIDATPIFVVVTGVLRIYADALAARRSLTWHPRGSGGPLSTLSGRARSEAGGQTTNGSARPVLSLCRAIGPAPTVDRFALAWKRSRAAQLRFA